MSRFYFGSFTRKMMERAGTAARAARYATCQMLREAGVLPSHTDYTPFIIFGMGRTGTTMLVSLLQSHPNCICYSELFHPHEPKWLDESKNYLERYEIIDR